MRWFLLCEDRRGFFQRFAFDDRVAAEAAYDAECGPDVVKWLRGVLISPKRERVAEFVCDAVDFVSDAAIEFHCGEPVKVEPSDGAVRAWWVQYLEGKIADLRARRARGGTRQAMSLVDREIEWHRRMSEAFKREAVRS